MDLLSYLLGLKKGKSQGGNIPDWNAIGYSNVPISLIDNYNIAKQIYDNWRPTANLREKYKGNKTIVYFPLVDTSTATTMRAMFIDCSTIYYVPKLNTHNVESMRNMLSNCDNLVWVEELDTSSVTEFQNMFYLTNNLNDYSLNNILKMCINATSFTGTKTLSHLGIGSTYTSRIPNLSNYQDFLDAGWTIS